MALIMTKHISISALKVLKDGYDAIVNNNTDIVTPCGAELVNEPVNWLTRAELYVKGKDCLNEVTCSYCRVMIDKTLEENPCDWVVITEHG